MALNLLSCYNDLRKVAISVHHRHYGEIFCLPICVMNVRALWWSV